MLKCYGVHYRLKWFKMSLKLTNKHQHPILYLPLYFNSLLLSTSVEWTEDCIWKWEGISHHSSHVLAQSLGEKTSRGLWCCRHIPANLNGLMYIRTTHCESIDNAQRELFTQKHRSPSLDYLPITSDHLYRYILRVVYMTSLIWGGALLKDPQRPIQSEWLWRKYHV